MPTTNNRKYLHKRAPFSDEELAVIIEEATVDSYGLDEQISSWAAYLEDELEFPFLVKVMGKTVQAIKIEEEYDCLKLVVLFDDKKYRVDITDVELGQSGIFHARNELLLTAYRKWRSNE